MGKLNIQRLKEKVGFKSETENVDHYFELIDRIYYQNQGHKESFDDKTEITTWFFEDGRRISLDISELTHLALFLMDLYQCPDENLLPVSQLERYFLEENEWKCRNTN